MGIPPPGHSQHATPVSRYCNCHVFFVQQALESAGTLSRVRSLTAKAQLGLIVFEMAVLGVGGTFLTAGEAFFIRDWLFFGNWHRPLRGGVLTGKSRRRRAYP